MKRGGENYYPLKDRYLVQAFALKNLAIVHQHYFKRSDREVTTKGYRFYGDQFAVGFMRHLKGNAARYHIDSKKSLLLRT